MDEVQREVKKLNSIAEIKRTSFSNVNLDWVLDLNSYDMTKMSKIDFINSQGLITGDICSPCGPTDNKEAIFNQIASKHSANSLTTFGFDFIGKVDLLLLSRFLDKILYGNKNTKETESISNIHTSNNGSGNSSSSNIFEMKIFRMKGILHVPDSLNLHILQSVHDMFDVQESSIIRGDSDDTTNGNNRIILIGRNMNNEYFEEGFKNCIVSNE
jgi:G3E family GTPase